MKHASSRAPDLLHGPVFSNMTRFFLPIMLGSLLQQLYSMVDAVVLGRLVGKTALAAVGGSDLAIINLVVGFFVGLASGACVVVSQHYGAGEDGAVRRAVHTAILFSVVIGIIKERLQQDDCKNGFILDGFPRTIPQAEALDAMGVQIDRVIDIEVADDKIIARMSGRRVCEACGASYHMEYLKPAKDGVCDKCGGALVQRKDDHPDTVKARLSVYHEQTEPLKAYYEKQGKLRIVEGQEDVADTKRLTLAAVEAE